MRITRIDFLEMLFGEQLEELLADRAAVFDVLAHGDDWQKRCGALTLLREHWMLPADILIPLYKSVAHQDKDERVRCKAIVSIGSFRAFSRDEELSRFVAVIALNPYNTAETRASALRSLRWLNRDSPAERTLSEGTKQIISELKRIQSVEITAEDLEWAKTFL